MKSIKAYMLALVIGSAMHCGLKITIPDYKLNSRDMHVAKAKEVCGIEINVFGGDMRRMYLLQCNSNGTEATFINDVHIRHPEMQQEYGRDLGIIIMEAIDAENQNGRSGLRNVIRQIRDHADSNFVEGMASILLGRHPIEDEIDRICGDGNLTSFLRQNIIGYAAAARSPIQSYRPQQDIDCVWNCSTDGSLKCWTRLGGKLSILRQCENGNTVTLAHMNDDQCTAIAQLTKSGRHLDVNLQYGPFDEDVHPEQIKESMLLFAQIMRREHFIKRDLARFAIASMRAIGTHDRAYLRDLSHKLGFDWNDSELHEISMGRIPSSVPGRTAEAVQAVVQEAAGVAVQAGQSLFDIAKSAAQSLGHRVVHSVLGLRGQVTDGAQAVAGRVANQAANAGRDAMVRPLDSEGRMALRSVNLAEEARRFLVQQANAEILRRVVGNILRQPQPTIPPQVLRRMMSNIGQKENNNAHEGWNMVVALLPEEQNAAMQVMRNARYLTLQRTAMQILGELMRACRQLPQLGSN